MSEAELISPSLVTEVNPTQAAGSEIEPADAYAEFPDFLFNSGETLASLKLHYLTLGSPRLDANGKIYNGVLLLHGTAGSATDPGVWSRDEMVRVGFED